MHLLLAQKGSVNESDEAVDLGQSPGDLVFLSAADTEIASLAAASKLRTNLTHSRETHTPLRLANLMQLSHPMSVDVYCENTLAKSKLIIVRVLGGESYWPYGLERIHATASSNKIDLVVLPGDDKPDAGLERFCTLERDICERLWQYLIQGGPQNMQYMLEYCDFLLERGEEPVSAIPLLKAGLWYPGLGICGLDQVRHLWQKTRPVVTISFYRALVQSGGLAPIEAMVNALNERGLNALPVFVSSLKDPVSIETLRNVFSQVPPDVVLNATGFAVSSPGGEHRGTVLDETGAPVLQIILAGSSHENWQASSQGLTPRDLAMNVALPEVDGRILARAIAFKNAASFDEDVQTNVVFHAPDHSRVDFVAELAKNWANLRCKEANERKVAVILANYPNRDGRLGNGVGLDTPAATANILNALRDSGYDLSTYPDDGDDLMRYLQEGPTNAANDGRIIRELLPLEQYQEFLLSLPFKLQDEITERWGKPKGDPFFLTEYHSFALPAASFGSVVVGIQPARGYNIDPKDTYHSPDLVPPHGYLAFYAWLRNICKVDVMVHLGKHGNLEWLPGKALSLSECCYPEAVMGPMPHLYPFIVNDPGEGSQAKRRTSAVIIDHLTPPLTRAESYGPLRDLEALVDEYYEASGNDPRRLVVLKKQILELISDIGLDVDAGIKRDDGVDEKLEKLDAYLCDLKEMQIRDGLHIFGLSPVERLRNDLICALVRVPRGAGEGRDQSLQRAIANDLNLGFDPLDCDMATPWSGPRPEILAIVDEDNWRSNGDTIERIEILASQLIDETLDVPVDFKQTRLVMEYVRGQVQKDVDRCGKAEIEGLLQGLAGMFVVPGPSGAPTRGRNDVLPTGRNFYSVDSRSVPTPTAWELGRKSAELLISRFRQDNGDWPISFGLSVWGTSNMRTGGDDIAQAMALIGTKPVWDHASRRVTGYEIITLSELGRPRVDVTLRISGFFRDAFPVQIDLFDKAIRAVGALDESERENPIAGRMRNDHKRFLEQGFDKVSAKRQSGFRIFGSKPGAYGAGLQALIDEKGWRERSDLSQAYLTWGSYAYGEHEEGQEEREHFSRRLSGVEAVIHNQDNREHDLLDSDDYYQFEGGMSAAIEQISGNQPKIYHNDHSRPEKPVIRALDEEIARVVRGRVVNPKWISGVMRHGYKGAFEMAATVDYLFSFSATTGAVHNHHFDLVFDAYLGDSDVLEFLDEKNPAALREIAERFLEAHERQMWTPRSNSARILLEEIAAR
ncbi:MAG: cobaltochelatase subunit CobN [Hyphomicrobiales bacterium]|nr:cobaltochelatase subunit CobN [Hyphomicrobiales bacterium]